MTSVRQIESNRRNAQKSTGPKSDSGKQRASQNAVRHGLTAETVIKLLEDPDDYQAFELAVTTGYDAETAVERELVLRLASLLWRLRRATSIETGLFQIQQEIMRGRRLSKQKSPRPQDPTLMALFQCPEATNKVRAATTGSDERTDGASQNDATASSESPTRSDVGLVIARCFSRLADLDKDVFDRFGRYEAALWRQVRQTIITLEALRWRGRSERRWRTSDRWQRAPPLPELHSDS